MCRTIYQTIKLAHTWFSSITLDEFPRSEVKWWLDNLKYFSKYPSWRHNFFWRIWFWIFCLNLDKHIKLKSAPFSQLDSAKSSIWRELFALHQSYTDESICVRFKGLTIRHYTDSKSVANILFKGSKMQSWNLMVHDIFLSLRKYHIKLLQIWLSRENEEIQLADLGSWENRQDDYSLAPLCLSKILDNFPPITVDAMASS